MQRIIIVVAACLLLAIPESLSFYPTAPPDQSHHCAPVSCDSGARQLHLRAISRREKIEWSSLCLKSEESQISCNEPLTAIPGMVRR
ncbi:MAG TPA: hypothetical protein VNQ79_24315 [Blastocatellia bacterium]|nr:hypothetical protein [Blastocatellia bacterium]